MKKTPAPARRGLPRPPYRERAGPDLRLTRCLRAHRAVRDVLPDHPGGHGQRPAGDRPGHRRPSGPGRPRGDRSAGPARRRGRCSHRGRVVGGVARTARLPVTFLGHVTNRATLSALQATADVILAPGPAETFGLAAVEALACGTPVVVSDLSALPGIIGPAGLTATDDGPAFATAVESLLARPERLRRAVARAQAERYGWPAAVDAFLSAHGAVSWTTVRKAAP